MFLIAIFGFLLLFFVLWDAFETIVLPRTVGRSLRLTRLFYNSLWYIWSALIRRIQTGARRQSLLATFGPLSLLLLFAMWFTLLIFGFALLHWGLQSPMELSSDHDNKGFLTYLYHSGTTFFTLGYGDVAPIGTLGRTLSVIESGVGFGLLAIVISYLPVIYQSFSHREIDGLLLDARAGSPPAAATLLKRHAEAEAMDSLTPLLRKYEDWSSELLESFISYPVLAYYRAQHEQLNWLVTLACVLDTCSLLQVGFEDESPWAKQLRWQAQLTFALGRHVLVDLSYLLNAPPIASSTDRLPREAWQQLGKELSEAGIKLNQSEADWAQLQHLRDQYELYLCGLAQHLFLTVPPSSTDSPPSDSWKTSAWDRTEQTKHF